MDIEDIRRKKESLEIEMNLAIIHSQQVCQRVEIEMKEINKRAKENMIKLKELLAII